MRLTTTRPSIAVAGHDSQGEQEYRTHQHHLRHHQASHVTPPVSLMSNYMIKKKSASHILVVPSIWFGKVMNHALQELDEHLLFLITEASVCFCQHLVGNLVKDRLERHSCLGEANINDPSVFEAVTLFCIAESHSLVTRVVIVDLSRWILVASSPMLNSLPSKSRLKYGTVRWRDLFQPSSRELLRDESVSTLYHSGDESNDSSSFDFHHTKYCSTSN